MLARWMVIGAVWAVASLAVAPPALAQPVFFDDFDGSDLLPHWRVPDPSHWEYNVSGGMLHVTELLFPSVPKLEANFAIMGARYSPQTDFRIDVWMGWESPPTQPFHDLFLSVNSAAGILAQFGLRGSLGAPPELHASAGAGAVGAPPPPPGMHQFTIARTGSQVDFYLNGDPFASLEDPLGITAEGVSLFFSKPFPGEMIPYLVDRVRVVPAPGTLVVSTLCVLACAKRQERSSFPHRACLPAPDAGSDSEPTAANRVNTRELGDEDDNFDHPARDRAVVLRRVSPAGVLRRLRW